MAYIDIDTDLTTYDSTSANLTIPAGASVLFAGLYWGGESTDTDALRGAVKLDTPATVGYSYSSLTATSLDGSTETPSEYHAFVDVTNLVSAGGTGTYTVGNVDGTSASTNKY